MRRTSIVARTITTDRLRLCAFDQKDTRSVLQLCSKPEVLKYLWDGQRLDVAQVGSFLAGSEKTFDSRGFGIWTIAEPTGPSFGLAGLRFVEDLERIELLYVLDPKTWGKGLATEAVRSILRYAFNTLSIGSIEASTHAENLRSVALLHRIGMVFRRNEKTPAGTLSVYSIQDPQFRDPLRWNEHA